MKKLNITKAAMEKKCSRQAMYDLVLTGRVTTIVENGKRLVVIDEKFDSLTIKRNVHPENKDKRIENLEKEIARLSLSQKNMQAELEQIKSQLFKDKEEKVAKEQTAEKNLTDNLISLGQIIDGFKVINKTVKGIKQYQAYKRIEGKQCYVYLCAVAKPTTPEQAEAKIKAYLQRKNKPV